MARNINRHPRPAATPLRAARPFLPPRAAQAVLGVLAMLLPAVFVQQLTTSSSASLPALVATPTPMPAVHAVGVPTLVLGRGLAPGACISYKPTHGQRGRVVFIDPGHGGADPGAVGITSAGARVYEKSLTLDLADRLRDLLRGDGYTAVLSRSGDSTVIRMTASDLSGNLLTQSAMRQDIAARVACANAAGAQVLVSLHFNAYTDQAVNGAETLYDRARPFSAANQRLATQVQQHLLASFHAAGWPVPDRGIIGDNTAGTPTTTTEAAAYGHLLVLGPALTGWLKTPSAMPGVMVEPLFITHAVETDIAMEAKGQQTMAAGIQAGIDAYFAGTSQPRARAQASATA